MLIKYKLHFISHNELVPLMESAILDKEISQTLKVILELEEKGHIRAMQLAEQDLLYYRSKVEQLSK